MLHHYLLWATGQDRPGIVAGVTEELFHIGANIEDSSMMRLGSEFGILLIFSSAKNTPIDMLRRTFAPLSRKLALTMDVKKISSAQAKFRPSRKALYTVAVHGIDRPGLVYRVTQLLAGEKFNITDLSTHRTTSSKRAGFILIIEGEISRIGGAQTLEKKLKNLAEKITTKITLNRVAPYTL